MFGLTTLGSVHTAIGLIAVIAGLIAFFRDKEISPRNQLGKVYIWTTALTCLTGFGIFRHGGFGIAHVLGIVTLIVLAVAVLAGRQAPFGRASPYVETIGLSATFFFHMIPGITESFTRFPAGAPLFTGPEDPKLEKVIGVVFLIFLVGAALQLRRLRASRRQSARGARLA
jgi:uncharacterized membrane protein